MKKIIYFKTLAAIVACLALALPASAYDFEKDGIYYTVNGTNATVTYKDANYNTYSGTVIIPATVTNGGTTYTVKSIGPSAFQGCYGLTRVVIPNSVQYIMNYAFLNCFNLPNITIPASVYTIYNQVFVGCSGLRSVICLRSVPGSWKDNIFDENTFSSATLYVPQGSADAYQPTAGTWNRFNRVVELECDFVQDAIFYKDLGNNRAAVTSVAYCQPSYSGDIVIPSTVTNGGITYTVTAVAFGAFYEGDKMTSIALPNTINEIDNYAFYGCCHLTSVSIPEGVPRLRYCTFGECFSLTEITIPSTVTYIEEGTFFECTGLETITCRAATPPECPSADSFHSTNYATATLRVPATSLNAYRSATAWKEFSNIEGYYYDFVENGIYYIITGPNTASVTFKDRSYNSYSGDVNVPATVVHEGITYTVTAVGRGAFYNCPGLTSVHLPNTVTDIGYAAFYNCTALTSINIPSGVTTLGDFCFQNCSSLISLTLPNGLVGIPIQCFTNCRSLTSINIPGTVKEIANFAFYGCINLVNVSIQNGVEIIELDAFGACTSLPTITLPASVSEIEVPAFDECHSLYEINVNSANTNYCSRDGVLFTAQLETLVRYPEGKSLTSYQVPDGVQVIEYFGFKDCDYLQSVTLPEGLQVINLGGFYDCSALEGIDVPHGVTTIGRSAFYNCSSMTYADLPSTLTTLDFYAFHDVPDLTTITVRATTPPECLTFTDEDSGEVIEPFMEDQYSYVDLVVPQGCAQAYRQANIWKKFTNISETDFPTEFTRGDVNGDGKISITDVSALINYLLSGNGAAVNLEAADVNEDGKVTITDVTALINYLLSGSWPAPEPMDMWYLMGNSVGSTPWINFENSVGSGLIPLYPVGEFNSQGRGVLTYTGYFGATDAFVLVHTPGNWTDGWVRDNNGNYIRGSIGGDNSTFCMEISGYYTITLNTQTDELSITPYDGSSAGVYESIIIVGPHCYWDVTDQGYNMTDLNPNKENHDWLFKNFTVTADEEIKFAADNNWDFNWGAQQFPWGRGVQGGMNVPVKKGTYDVYFNDITGDFNFIPVN